MACGLERHEFVPNLLFARVRSKVQQKYARGCVIFGMCRATALDKLMRAVRRLEGIVRVVARCGFRFRVA